MGTWDTDAFDISLMISDSANPTDIPAIQMKLVMISGRCSNKTNILHLKKDLFIGSSKKCDITLQENDVSSQHARIYFENGVVYIEDLQSKSGTYIEGMRIHAVNRLRSGDVISVGKANFKLLF